MRKLLIVEDDVSIREAFSIILRLNAEYEVTTAENGRVALDLCNQNTYDLILLDIMMPVMDGPTFLKEYSSIYPVDVTKIIIMSNLSSGSELSLVQDLGVDKTVLKSSITPERLMSIVAEALEQQGSTTREFKGNRSNSDDVGAIDNDERSVSAY
ncbi:MAG: DNA-binding response regulator VicR [Candidatus Saccharibacteria bacterium]|nr:DNA-binding response regulator VicR [Candidatus Saccharibacteria bacterium]